MVTLLQCWACLIRFCTLSDKASHNTQLYQTKYRILQYTASNRLLLLALFCHTLLLNELVLFFKQFNRQRNVSSFRIQVKSHLPPPPHIRVPLLDDVGGVNLHVSVNVGSVHPLACSIDIVDIL